MTRHRLAPMLPAALLLLGGCAGKSLTGLEIGAIQDTEAIHLNSGSVVITIAGKEVLNMSAWDFKWRWPTMKFNWADAEVSVTDDPPD